MLTDRRLFFIKTRVGAFKPLLENKGVEELDRGRISRAVEDDYLIAFHLDDGTVRTLWVPIAKKHFSNQEAFLRDIPRLVGAGTIATVEVKDPLAGARLL